MKKTILTLLTIVSVATLMGCNEGERFIPKHENDKIFSSALSEALIDGAGKHSVVISGTAADEIVKIKLPTAYKGKLKLEDGRAEAEIKASQVVGDYSIKINAEDLAPGHYVIELESKGGSPKFIINKRTETLVVK